MCLSDYWSILLIENLFNFITIIIIIIPEIAFTQGVKIKFILEHAQCQYLINF